MRSDHTGQHKYVAAYGSLGAFCKWALTLGSGGGRLHEAGLAHT